MESLVNVLDDNWHARRISLAAGLLLPAAKVSDCPAHEDSTVFSTPRRVQLPIPAINQIRRTRE